MWNSLREFASVVDDTLAELVSLPLGYLDERNREEAMKNPEFATIAEKRRNRTSGSLSWEDFQRQWDIMDEVGESPWWEESARFFARRPATSLVREVQFAWQRVSRGWDDSATWSLDVYLAKSLSQQLNHLADTSHGWPGGPDSPYPEFEDWQFALRENALKLRRYADGKFNVPDLDFKGTDADLGALLEEQYCGAQEAMRWVADNFGSLWD